jgi:hypothetical protein
LIGVPFCDKLNVPKVKAVNNSFENRNGTVRDRMLLEILIKLRSSPVGTKCILGLAAQIPMRGHKDGKGAAWHCLPKYARLSELAGQAGLV